MIKSILGGKSKNLFDISKVITSSVVKRNGNSLICSVYGTSIGTLGSICPTLKLSDTITVSFKYASEGAPSNFMAFGTRVFSSGATFIVSEIGLSTPWYLYNTDWEHRDLPNKTTYSDIQLEVSTNATEYVPHELTSYKSIMKVSDVCQLGNKQKYNDSETKSGVTFTNNGDGTITVNGTSTQIVDFNLQFIDFIKNHTYLLIGCPSGGSNLTYILDTSAGIGNDTGNGTISKPIFPGNKYLSIYVYANATCNNLVFKPQLFDLTEMFGAGNEPKTVAEFKAKFPNDYYPYSPSCFVTSFDERMPCKTKNLFDINAEMHNAIKPEYYIEVIGSIVKTNYDISHIKHPYIEVPVKIGETYTFSCNTYKSSNTINVFSRVRYPDNTVVTYIGKNPVKKTFTATQSSIQVCFGIDTGGTFDTSQFAFIYNIQLEKGSTATDYVPYGYV